MVGIPKKCYNYFSFVFFYFNPIYEQNLFDSAILTTDRYLYQILSIFQILDRTFNNPLSALVKAEIYSLFLHGW